MKIFTTVVQIALALIVVSPQLHSQQDPSIAQDSLCANERMRVTGSVYGVAAIHSSSFAQLPLVPNCCTEFTGALGFNPAIQAGVEIVPQRKLAGMVYRFGAQLGYQGLSATLEEDEFIGNIIINNGTESVKGISRHSIAASLSTLHADAYLLTYPKQELPLAFRIGVLGGLFVSKEYNQVETLVEPTNAFYNDTKSNSRNAASGTIADVGVYSALTAGLRYDFPLSPTLTISPELIGAYSFTNVSSSLDWLIHTVRVGATVQYHLHPTVAKPEPPPVIPVLPTPQPPKELSLTLRVEHNGNPVPESSVAVATIPVQTRAERELQVPRIFFAPQSAAPLSTQLFSAIEQTVQSNPQSVVGVRVSHSADEPSSLATERGEFIRRELSNRGIDAARIRITTAAPTKVRYEELQNEQRSAVFNIQQKGAELPLVASIFKEEFVSTSAPSHIVIHPTLRRDTSLTVNKLSVNVNGKEKVNGEIIPSETHLQVDDLLREDSTRVTIQVQATDVTGNSRTMQRNFVVIPKKEYRDTLYNIVPQSNESEVEYILGYCEFDKAQFYSTDSLAFARVRTLHNRGNIVELVASTDDFGSDEHNTLLAERRAKEALRILGSSYSSIPFSVTPKATTNEQNSALSRMKNRSVKARVKLK